MQAAILKTSTGSQICLVSKAKDKTKIKTYEQSVFCIGKLEKAYNYHSGSYGLAVILKSK